MADVSPVRLLGQDWKYVTYWVCKMTLMFVTSLVAGSAQMGLLSGLRSCCIYICTPTFDLFSFVCGLILEHVLL